MDAVVAFEYLRKILHNLAASVKFFHDWIRNEDTVTVSIYETDDNFVPNDSPTTIVIPSLKAIQKNNYLTNAGNKPIGQNFLVQKATIENAAGNILRISPVSQKIISALDLKPVLANTNWLNYTKSAPEEVRDILVYVNALSLPTYKGAFYTKILRSDSDIWQQSRIGVDDGTKYYAGVVEGVPGAGEIAMVRPEDMGIPLWIPPQKFNHLISPTPPNYTIVPYSIKLDSEKMAFTIKTISDTGDVNPPISEDRLVISFHTGIDDYLWQIFNSPLAEMAQKAFNKASIEDFIRRIHNNKVSEDFPPIYKKYEAATVPPFQNPRYSVLYFKSSAITTETTTMKLVFDNMKNSTVEAFECESEGISGAVFLPLWFFGYDMHKTVRVEEYNGLSMVRTNILFVDDINKTVFVPMSRGMLWSRINDTTNGPTPIKDIDAINFAETSNTKAMTGLLFPADSIFLSHYASPAFRVGVWWTPLIKIDPNLYSEYTNLSFVLQRIDNEQAITINYGGAYGKASEFSELDTAFFYTAYNEIFTSMIDAPDISPRRRYSAGVLGNKYYGISVSNLPKLITQYLASSPTTKWTFANVKFVNGILTRIRAKQNYRYDLSSGIRKALDATIPIPRNPFGRFDGDDTIIDDHGYIIEGGHLTVPGSIGIGIYSLQDYVVTDADPEGTTSESQGLTAKLEYVVRPDYVDKQIPGTWWEVEAIDYLDKWEVGDEGLVTIDVSEAGDGSMEIENVVVGTIVVINNIPILWAPRLKYRTYDNVLAYNEENAEAVMNEYIDKRNTYDALFGFGKVPIYYSGYSLPKDKYAALIGLNKPYETTKFGIGWFFGLEVSKEADGKTYNFLLPFIFPNDITNDVNELSNLNSDGYYNENYERTLIDFSVPLYNSGGKAAPINNRWKWALILRREIAKIFSNGITGSSAVAIKNGTIRYRNGYPFIGGVRMRIEARDLLETNYPISKDITNMLNPSVLEATEERGTTLPILDRLSPVASET